MRLFLSACSGLVPLPKVAGQTVLFFGRIILIFQGPTDSLLSSCPRWCSLQAVQTTDPRQPVLSTRQTHSIAACLLHPSPHCTGPAQLLRTMFDIWEMSTAFFHSQPACVHIHICSQFTFMFIMHTCALYPFSVHGHVYFFVCFGFSR